MLLLAAIGDAYGAGFEFVRPQAAQPNDTTTYYSHPELDLGGGAYTDDTQMMLAVTEVITTCGEPTAEQFAEQFVRAYHRDPRNGYGKRFKHLLDSVTTGAELTAAIDPTSTRCGAAMRAGPIGLYRDLPTLMHVAQRQAMVTHNTPKAIACAQAVAAMTHWLAYSQNHDRSRMPVVVNLMVQDYTSSGIDFSQPWAGWATVEAEDCTRAAITAVSQATSQRDLLERCIGFGGDVDSIAAIAMFAAGFAKDIPVDLPLELHEGLERGEFGHDYLVAMDHRLITWTNATQNANFVHDCCGLRQQPAQ